MLSLHTKQQKGDAFCANSLFKKKGKVFCYLMFARKNEIMLLEILVNVPCTVHDGEGTEFTSVIPADFSEEVVVLTA